MYMYLYTVSGRYNANYIYTIQCIFVHCLFQGDIMQITCILYNVYVLVHCLFQGDIMQITYILYNVYVFVHCFREI